MSLEQTGRSVMVELNGGYSEAAPAAEAASDAPPAESPQPPRTAEPGHAPAPPSAPEPPRAVESQTDGVARAAKILAAARTARWPMYLRNVKQILRQAEGGFDERRYGFGGLMDLLKALQRDGLVRIERDRRGGLRVFQGSKLQLIAVGPPMTGLPQPDVEDMLDASDEQPLDAQPGQSIAAPEPLETEQPEAEPMPIDTTAELLGRATKRKPRTSRLPRVLGAAAPKRAAKKAPARKTRGKKAPATEADDSQN